MSDKETRRIELSPEVQEEKKIVFFPHKHPAVWWSETSGGEWSVHADFILLEGGNLSEAMEAILSEDEEFGNITEDGYAVHFKISCGPITSEEWELFKERMENV